MVEVVEDICSQNLMVLPLMGVLKVAIMRERVEIVVVEEMVETGHKMVKVEQIIME